MQFRANRCALLKRVAASYLMTLSTVFAMGQVNFMSAMGAPSWRMSGNPIRCGLALTLPNFGIGYFEQYATQPPHFILRQWNEVQRPVAARLLVKSPIWKPAEPIILAGKVIVNPGPFSIFLKRDSTLKLLTYLSQGYETAFNYQSEGFRVTVSLTPEGFQKPYLRYQQCIGRLLSFGYDQVKENVFHYAPDSRELTDQDKQQLRRIAQYVAADTQIKAIRIVGYADESGRRGYNNAISQDRAQTVQNYLVMLGVPDEQLSVTWMGALKPVARNDTDSGRALNRRVVISLIKK